MNILRPLSPHLPFTFIIVSSFFLESFGRYRITNGRFLIIFGILNLMFIFLYRKYSIHLNRIYGPRVVCIIYISLLCLTSLFCCNIRLFVYDKIFFVFSNVLTVFMGTCAVSGSDGQIIPHSSPSNSSSEDSFGLQVLSEPWPVNHNFAYESSLRNRILALENDDCIFLLNKEKGEYWREVKNELDNCPSQSEYNRLLDFENRDLQIRERKHACYSIFQQILLDHPALAENAAYNPQEAFFDFLVNKRDCLDQQDGTILEKDNRELTFLNELYQNLQRYGQLSPYIKNIL